MVVVICWWSLPNVLSEAQLEDYRSGGIAGLTGFETSSAALQAVAPVSTVSGAASIESQTRKYLRVPEVVYWPTRVILPFSVRGAIAAGVRAGRSFFLTRLYL